MAFMDLPWFPIAVYTVILLLGAAVCALLGRRSYTARALVPQFGVGFVVMLVLVVAWTFLATPPPPGYSGH